MRIFGMGLPELVIILVIILIIGGPALVKRISKTGKAAKKSIEGGAKAAGVDVDKIKEENAGKSVSEKIESMQDKIDEKLESKKDLKFDDEDEDEA